jgi:endonuclease-8
VPEGDTIHKTAARLRPALEGRTLVRIELARGAMSVPKPGTRIEEVSAVGKHLLVRFADGHVLQTHLRMTGRWDVYRTGETWRRPRHLARAVIEVDDAVAVCFTAPVVRMLHEKRGEVAAAVDHLGPDLCRPDADLDEVVRRMADVDQTRIVADVLLDQHVAAGIGNVFKSEVLWACGVHPATPIGCVGEGERRELVEVAARQLRANLSTSRRTTVAGPPGSLAVYQRDRGSCRRCGAPIRAATLGEHRRVTYWCPRCQQAPDVSSDARPTPS